MTNGFRRTRSLLYGEIAALCGREGYCWASNRHFADLYGVSRGTVTNWIRALEKSGYITTTLDRGVKGNVERRRIYAVKNPSPAEKSGVRGGRIPELGAVKKEAGGGQLSEGGGQETGGGWSTFSRESITKSTTKSTTRTANAREAKVETKTKEDGSGGDPVKTPANETRTNEREEAGGGGSRDAPPARSGDGGRGEEREKVKARWVENYRELYGEAPVDEKQRAQDGHIDALIGKIGADVLLTALERAKNEAFCLERGYVLKIILSENVLSRLLHSGRPVRKSEYVEFFEKYCGLAAA
jgi:hypothetical protein